MPCRAVLCCAVLCWGGLGGGGLGWAGLCCAAPHDSWHETAAHGMEVGGAAAAELKLHPVSGVPAPVPTDASKRVIYQDKMADQDAPQRFAPACKAWLNWLHSVREVLQYKSF